LKEKVEQALINERIRAPRLQLITHEGSNIGIVPRDRALQMAREVGLDLVLIAESGSDGVPVVKIMDFGKAQYAKKKKQTEAKKHQKVIQIKELKMTTKIGEHDFQTKMNQAIQFLKEGKRVKVTLVFKGREIATKDERGHQFFDKINALLEAQGILKNVVQETEGRGGAPTGPASTMPGAGIGFVGGKLVLWARVYYLKTATK
jgi:translation initiation factor IF-3